MKYLLSLTLFVAALLLPPPNVSAHYLRQSSGATIELHMPPNDEPKAREPTRLELDYQTKTGRLNLADCACKVRVMQADTNIATASVRAGPIEAGQGGTASVTFPKIGEYTLHVEGESRSQQFKAFSVVYPVQVKAVSDKAQGWSLAEIIVLGGGSGMLLLGVVADYVYRRRPKR